MTVLLIAYWFTAMLAVLFALDAWTTWQVFRFGGFEKSPLVRFLISEFGLAAGLVIAKVGICGGVIAYGWWKNLWTSQLGIAGLAVMVSMYVAVVWNNWQKLQIHKGGD